MVKFELLFTFLINQLKLNQIQCHLLCKDYKNIGDYFKTGGDTTIDLNEIPLIILNWDETI